MRKECMNVSLNNRQYKDCSNVQYKDDMKIISFFCADCEVIAKVDNIIIEKVIKNIDN